MERNDTAPAQKSAWGAALVAGLATGLAAGLFIQSDKGREMTGEARRRARRLQRELRHRIRDAKNLTQDKYEELVDDIVEYYGQTKNLAAAQLAELKQRLLDDWEDIRAQLQGEDEREENEEMER